MRVVFALLLAGAWHWCCLAQNTAPQTFNLQQCIEIALSKNVDLARTNLTVARTRINWQQERDNRLPDINAGVTHGMNQGRSINPLTNTYVSQDVGFASPRLNGSLLLFNGLMQQNLIKQYCLIYQTSVAEEAQAKHQLRLNVMLAYLEVLTNQELLTLLQTQQQTTLKQLERLEILNNSGAIAPGEYYDLKGQYANDQLNLINAANELENSKIALVKLLNIPYSKKMTLQQLQPEQFSLSYDQEPAEVYQTAVRQFALVKAATLRKRSSDVQLKSSRSGYFPSLYFNSSLSSNFSNAARNPFDQPIPYFEQYNNNLSKSFSISVNLPLFNSFRTKNAIAISKINQRENEVLLQTTLTELQQAIEQAYFNMTAAKERYLSLTEQVNAYKESFRTVEIRFNAGALTVVDYLIAKNNLDRASMNKLTGRYDFIVRKKVLDFYQGNLSE
jgi:outer membrane protein